jgi:hypothetical protein
MPELKCGFARAADNTPICPIHKHQLTIESEHGDLEPPGARHLRGRCPVSGQLVVEGESNAVQVSDKAA